MFSFDSGFLNGSGSGFFPADVQPVRYIGEVYGDIKKIDAVEVGCGYGSYSLKLLSELYTKVRLHCIDSSHEKLCHLRDHLLNIGLSNIYLRKGEPHNLPFPIECMDAVFNLNSIHRMDVSGFLKSSAATLKDGGNLFIYTRFTNQNADSLWGKYFPKFMQKENRLLDWQNFKHLVRENNPLKITDAKRFKISRHASLSNLLETAKNHRNGIFSTYADSEFNECLKGFEANLIETCDDTNDICWMDEKTVLKIDKQ